MKVLFYIDFSLKNKIAKSLNIRSEAIYSYSSQTGMGKEELLKYIENKLEQ